MDLGKSMRQYIGITVDFENDEKGTIVNAFSCYDGEFFEIKMLNGKNKDCIIRVRNNDKHIYVAIEKYSIRFTSCICVLVKHEENYNKPVDMKTVKDNVIVYDSDCNYIWDTQTVTKCNDWFGANIFRKENENILVVDTFSGVKFQIDVNNKVIIDEKITK